MDWALIAALGVFVALLVMLDGDHISMSRKNWNRLESLCGFILVFGMLLCLTTALLEILRK